MNEHSWPPGRAILLQQIRPFQQSGEEAQLWKEIEHLGEQRRLVIQHEFQLDQELSSFNNRYENGFFDERMRQEFIGRYLGRLNQIQSRKRKLESQLLEKEMLLKQLMKTPLSPPPLILTPPLTPQSVSSNTENPFPEEKICEIKQEEMTEAKPDPDSQMQKKKSSFKSTSAPEVIDLTSDDEEGNNQENHNQEVSSSNEQVMDNIIDNYCANIKFVPSEIPDLMEDLGEVQYPSPSFDKILSKELRSKEAKVLPKAVLQIKSESCDDDRSILTSAESSSLERGGHHADPICHNKTESEVEHPIDTHLSSLSEESLSVSSKAVSTSERSSSSKKAVDQNSFTSRSEHVNSSTLKVLSRKSKQSADTNQKGKDDHPKIKKAAPKPTSTPMSDIQRRSIAERILKKKQKERRRRSRDQKRRSEVPSDLHVNVTRRPLEFACYQQRSYPSQTPPDPPLPKPVTSPKRPNIIAQQSPSKDFGRNFFEVFEKEYFG